MLHYLLEQQNKYCNQKSENFENFKRDQNSENFEWIRKNVGKFQYVLLK